MMSAFATELTPAVIAQCQLELTGLVKQAKGGSGPEKVLSSLAGIKPASCTPTVLRVMSGMTANSYDLRMADLNRAHVSSSVRAVHARNRSLQATNLSAILCRMRNMHAMPVATIRRGLEYKYLGCHSHLWNLSRSYREVPGESWIQNVLAAPSVMAWRPPPQEELSDEIDLCCRDNLEWYRKLKYARYKDGVKLESELIHTVTGEHFHIAKSLVDHLPDPQLGDDWPFMGTYNYANCIVDLNEMHIMIAPLWQKILALQKSNPMQLLMRPPPEADKVRWEGPTRIWHPNVILNCGTSSYVDNVKIVKNVRANRVGKKSIIACDMQTFVRLWWLKKKYPSVFKDIVPWAGDFHGLAHLVDGIVILNWSYILEPIMLHFDVKGFHLKLNMKETSQRIRWIILILCAGQQWLCSVFSEEELNDIPKLLDRAKGNVAVWGFIGFLFYHASMVWGCKEATQTSDTTMLNFMWRFSLRVYAHTNKNIYKKGCIQQNKIENDSEERVQLIQRHHRTCNDTGRPCSGTALDYRNEKVCCITNLFMY